MIQIFNFRVDPTSFWLGFVMGAILIWLLVQFRTQFPAFIRSSQKQFNAVRQSMSAGVRARLLTDLHYHAQRQHLATALFPLDQVLIQPRLMPLPVRADAAVEFVQDEITHRVVPYLPDWPALAAAYHAPTITLVDALENGANILLIGHPGSGKSVALAHLVSQMAAQDPQAQHLANRFPILVHAADLINPASGKDLLSPLSSAVASAYASPLVLPRLHNLVHSLFTEGSVLLLVDGLDEFEPASIQKIKVYLESVLATYPKVQLVAAASCENFGGLNRLGLIPHALACWTDEERKTFADQWGNAWMGLQKDYDPTDPQLIKERSLVTYWLESADLASTPFELTIKTWASFAGDINGSELPRLIDLHIRRLAAAAPNSQPVLELLALHMLTNQKVIISAKEAETVIRTSGEATASLEEIAAQENPGKPEKENKKNPAQVGLLPVLDSLLGTGILSMHNKTHIRFAHPMLASFLAGKALAKNGGDAGRITRQPVWTGKLLSLGFFNCYADLGPYLEPLLEESSDLPTQSSLFHIARWLRLPAKNPAWRAGVLRSLANMMYKEYATVGLSYRAMTALALSGDPSINGLFRQMQKSDNPALRQIAALGFGLMKDVKTIYELSALIQDPAVNVSRSACLALVRIGTKPAVDTIIGVLLNNTEEMRRAAAEALAVHAGEGLDIMKEALTMPDLLVRRAAIFGLMRLEDPEVIKLLEKTAVSDGQWVVRNLAVQALEQKRAANPLISKPLPAITDLPWLIVYAAHSGIGVVNEKDAMNLVIAAVERGELKERLEALQYLSLRGDQLAAKAVYNVFFGSTDVLRAAAFDAIWHIQASGAPMPLPQQFGLS